MKLAKTKAAERREIENQIRHYLASGGQVNVVEPGVSGREIGGYKLTPVTFEQRQQTRTPLIEEVKAIEARKHPPPPQTRRHKRPRRVLITDDFGEPLRWSWKD